MFFLVFPVVAKCVARRNFINFVLTEVHCAPRRPSEGVDTQCVYSVDKQCVLFREFKAHFATKCSTLQ